LGILLKGDQEEGPLEEELELLKLFQESADFGQLRSLFEKILLNVGRVEVVVKSTNSLPEYEIEINQV
jgi:hypothetical protein